MRSSYTGPRAEGGSASGVNRGSDPHPRRGLRGRSRVGLHRRPRGERAPLGLPTGTLQQPPFGRPPRPFGFGFGVSVSGAQCSRPWGPGKACCGDFLQGPIHSEATPKVRGPQWA